MSVLTFLLHAWASHTRPHFLNAGHNHIYFALRHSGSTKERHPQLRQRPLQLTDGLTAVVSGGSRGGGAALVAVTLAVAAVAAAAARANRLVSGVGRIGCHKAQEVSYL